MLEEREAACTYFGRLGNRRMSAGTQVAFSFFTFYSVQNPSPWDSDSPIQLFLFGRTLIYTYTDMHIGMFKSMKLITEINHKNINK